jgi:hypothetical protein
MPRRNKPVAIGFGQIMAVAISHQIAALPAIFCSSSLPLSSSGRPWPHLPTTHLRTRPPRSDPV